MKLAKILSPAVVALTLGLFAHSAQAAPTILLGQSSGLSTFDQFVDFEQNFAPNTVITNQFAGSGITFAALGDGAVRFDSCGNNAWNNGQLAGHTINTYGPSCNTNGTDDSFSLTFNAAVSAASFAYYLGTYNPNFPTTIQTLLNGVVNATLVTSDFSPGIAVISGGAFDEIRFLEGTLNHWIVMDNLAFQYAEVSGVPAPGALALLGLGLFGIGGFRRKRA